MLAPASLLLAWPWLRPAATGWQDACGAVLGLMGERVGAAAMAGTPPMQLASALLHDRLTGTRVLAPAGRSLPRWSKAWLALVVIAAAAATLWIAALGAKAANAAINAGFERAPQ